MKSIVQFALRSYKRFVSPMLPPSCKFTPTCSEYAMQAVEHHGVLRGGLMSAWRLLRCNPFSKGGYDPVEKRGTKRKDTQKVSHPERSEGCMHFAAARECIDASLRSG